MEVAAVVSCPAGNEAVSSVPRPVVTSTWSRSHRVDRSSLRLGTPSVDAASRTGIALGVERSII
jgi:hypothetical protein